MTSLLPLLLLLSALLEGDPLPRDLSGWMRRQDAQAERGEGDRAVAEARERAGREPKSPEALFLLGRVLGNAGKIDEARANFQAALDADPNYSPGWRGMALVHLREKEFETAAREARRAYELEESPENRVLLVQALYEKGDRPGAYRLLQEALAKSPGDDDLRAFYATRLLNEGLFRDAEREIRQVLASDAGHPAARQMLVAVLLNTGREDEAVSECRDLVRRNPKEPGVRVKLYELLVGLKDYAGAASALDDLLKLELPADFRAKAERLLVDMRAAAGKKAAVPGPGLAAELDEKEILRQLESKDVETRRAAMRTL